MLNKEVMPRITDMIHTRLVPTACADCEAQCSLSGDYEHRVFIDCQTRRIYALFEAQKKEWANNMADWLKTWWASLSYSTTYYEELKDRIAELRQMSEK